MKFKCGDEIDGNLCVAIVHEFLRCEESFNRFCFYKDKMIREGKNKVISFHAYNAYSDFIHHLYEFMVACCSRDYENTEVTSNKKIRVEVIDSYINHHVQRLLDNKRENISENDIKCYSERAPKEFAKEFRRYRNKTSGHATYERASKLSLSQFYEKYHKYLFLLFYDGFWWKGRNLELPDLKEITDFSVLIKNKKI